MTRGKELAADRGPLLDVADLTVHYPVRNGWFAAVQQFDLKLDPRARVAVVGESGSGKTTACLAIAQLLPREAVVKAETMKLAGRSLLGTRRHPAIARHVRGTSVVFQNAMTSLDPVWTVESQLTAALRSTGPMPRAEARAAAAAWVQRVGLRDVRRVLGSRPYELSGGMRQRVMLAIAMCTSPRLLIADEPTSALDATLSKDVLELMVHLTDEVGSALLIVTHDIGLSRGFTHWTVVMHRGRVVEQGPSAQLSTEPQHAYTRALVRCVPTLANFADDRLPTMGRLA